MYLYLARCVYNEVRIIRGKWASPADLVITGVDCTCYENGEAGVGNWEGEDGEVGMGWGMV